MENYNEKAEKVLREMELLAGKDYANIIGPEKGRLLVEIINKIKSKLILEIGTLHGYSAIYMAKELGPDCKLITIERDKESTEIAKENLEQAGITADVKIYNANALDVLRDLQNVSFDLVFLDGHKEQNMDYLRIIERMLHKGSVVVADDAGIMADKMENYLNYVRSSGKYESKFTSVDHGGMEISVKL